MFGRQKSIDVLGWAEYSTANKLFSWTHLSVRDDGDGRAKADITSDTFLFSVFEQVQQKGEPALFILDAQEASGDMYFAAIHPVYAPVDDGRLAGLLGLSFGVINFDTILRNSFTPETLSFFNVSIQGGGEAMRSYTGSVSPQAYEYHASGFSVNHPQIRFVFEPTTQFFQQQKNHTALSVFIVMATLTLSILLMWRLAQHARDYERAKRKAEEANRLKSEFLATISHEIRSPMSGVLGMAELLLETRQSPEQEGYTKTIINCGEALLNIIDDILNLSKIEANKIELSPVAVNMQELIDDICALYTVKAREKALELAVRYVPGTEQFVYADPVRIRQILGNLLNNAIKFTHKGSVSITVQEDKSAITSPDKIWLSFTVRDTGIGMNQDAIPRIFDKFSQADSSTTRYYGGTGLGLSICKRLAEIMGGEIRVESSPGEGSTFSFTLPFKRNTGDAYKWPKPEILKDVKALIVDDLGIVRTVMQERLLLAGMRTTTAAAADEALEYMYKAAHINDPYDIVIIDYLMPGMNGEELASMIKSDPLLDKTCLIMLSAAGNSLTGQELEQKGFAAYIAKPVKADEVAHIVAGIWEGYTTGNQEEIMYPTVSAAHHEHYEAQDLWLEGTKILLAEDSRINQAFATEVLESMGCEVSVVANGKEALDKIQDDAEGFAMIFMDCQMPVMDGFEATAHLVEWKKQGRLNNHLPIIALTANAMQGDREKCLDAGMSDYLSKPVRTRELKEMLAKWMVEGSATANTLKSVKIQAGNGASFGKKNSSGEILNMADVGAVQIMFKDRYAKMVDYYLEDTQSYLSEIGSAIESGALADVIRPAHTIKSSSMRMGAGLLAHLAQDMEQACLDAHEGRQILTASQLRRRFKDMDKTFRRTEQSLRQTSAGQGKRI